MVKIDETVKHVGGSSPETSKKINVSYETHFLFSWKSMANM